MQFDAFIRLMRQTVRLDNPQNQVYKQRNDNDVISRISKNRIIEKLISTWLNDRFENKVSKCSARATTSKNAGNDFFKKKDFVNSLSSYSESAKFSVIGNDFAVAIANRSASLFHMCRYEECLGDIEVAIESGYPKKLLHKVLLRAAHCHIKLRNSRGVEDMITKARDIINSDNCFSECDRENLLKQISMLSSDAETIPPVPKSRRERAPEIMTPEKLMEINENYSSASPSLTRAHSPTRGRFVVATKPIKKGEILFVEKPFAFVPLDHETSKFMCDNCCGELADLSYPCRGGCVKVSYCCPKCWRESWELYHRWECPGYEMGIWQQMGIAHLAMKVLLVSTTSHDIDKFNEVQKLVTNIEHLSDADLTIYSLTALTMSQYLIEHTSFFSEVDLKKSLIDKFTRPENTIPFAISTHGERKTFITCLLLRHILQLIANGHAITRLNLMNLQEGDVVDEQQQRVAVGIYPSVSMMNHSCDPTIINTFWNDYLIVKSMKNVEIGEEILNCYGPHFRHMSVKERQNVLSQQYHFQCKCPPCTDPALQRFLNHDHIASTLDDLAKQSATMGQWLDAISYLEERLSVVEERYGADSIEVVNELNKITDVCQQYVRNTMNRQSKIYKNVLKKFQQFLDRGVELTQLLSGPWDKAWREFEEKKEDIAGILEALHISE